MDFDYPDDNETDRPIAVAIHDDMVWVTLADGRKIGNPLESHTWLAEATAEQQANIDLRAFSVDWPDLDEGLDIEGMLRGIKPRLRESIKTTGIA
ncbi:MAG: DUF2442 domain-containing protein [Burkholderiales bacterium]|nr:DUF2442 domain-containing protein [Anaerolineae bacterium]